MRTLVSVFSLSLFLSVLIFACKKELAPPPPTEVFVLTLKEQPAVVYQEWVGNMEGSNDTEIRAQVKGYLIRIAYKEGTQVEEGDLLFEIDPREAKAELQKAQANYRKRAADVKRMRALIKSGAVSRKEYDDARESFESAKGNLDQAKINLGYATIRSPITGIAGISKAKVGDLVGVSGDGTVLTTISQLDKVKISFAVSERFYLQKVREKSLEDRVKERVENEENNLELILADGKPYQHKGRIVILDRQVNTSTGTITLQAYFPNPEGLLRPGLFGRIRAPTDVIPNAILVPQRSIRDMQGIKQLALVNAENKTSFKTIETGDEIGSFVIVKSGLKPGDRIVVEGLQKIREGGVIAPQKPPENLIPPLDEFAVRAIKEGLKEEPKEEGPVGNAAMEDTDGKSVPLESATENPATENPQGEP